MAFNGSGTFLINSTGQPVVTGTVISSTVFNALTADLATGLTTCITKDGQTTPTANIPMGTYKITGLGSGTAATDAVALGQLQNGDGITLGSVSGTNTITASASPAITAYAAKQHFLFVPANTNSGATTININGLGAKNVYYNNAACTGGELVSGVPAQIVYDGTQFQILSTGSGVTRTGAETLTNKTLTAPTINGTITSTVTSGKVFDDVSGTTSSMYMNLQNTSGRSIMGTESSAGGALATGSAAYAAVFGSLTGVEAHLISNGVVTLTSNAAGTALTSPVSIGLSGGVYPGATQTAASLISQSSSGAGTTTTYIGNQTITTSSDERIKINLRQWDGDATAILDALPVKAWDSYTQDAPVAGYTGGYVGFTAQDLHKVAPWAVNTQGDTGLPWQARYEFLNGLIVKGLQQLNARLAKLENAAPPAPGAASGDPSK